MLNPTQFRLHVIEPTLSYLGHNSLAAVKLVLGTALQESRLTFLVQLDGGPALGLYQMEPATHDDIWENYLRYREGTDLWARLFDITHTGEARELVGNLAYATAMCRVHYLRVPHPLPDADDLEGIAHYWKRHYNTPEGKGTVEEFVKNTRDYL